MDYTEMLTTVRLIKMKFAAHIHGPIRINLGGFSSLHRTSNQKLYNATHSSQISPGMFIKLLTHGNVTMLEYFRVDFSFSVHTVLHYRPNPKWSGSCLPVPWAYCTQTGTTPSITELIWEHLVRLKGGSCTHCYDLWVMVFPSVKMDVITGHKCWIVTPVRSFGNSTKPKWRFFFFSRF